MFFVGQLLGTELDTLIQIIAFNPHIDPPTNEETEARKDGLTSPNCPAEPASEPRSVLLLKTMLGTSLVVQRLRVRPATWGTHV